MVDVILSAAKTKSLNSGKQIIARCRELGIAPYSDMKDGLFRAYLTPAHAATVNKVSEWIVQAGMSARIDAAANLIGRYEGSSADAPALVIGSHLDSVRDAGVFDGPLGVMLGLACVEHLNSKNICLPFAIEVVGFGDEEGSRFHRSMISSRAFAGLLKAEDLDVCDRAKKPLLDAIAEFSAMINLELPQACPLSAKRPANEIFAYLEAHIEQGPILQAEDLAVGSVRGIASQLRSTITVKGRAAHAGTTTMSLRQDALAGAARMVSIVEHIAQGYGDDLMATVGSLTVGPGSSNVIPGEVQFTTDIRSIDIEMRDQAATKIFDKFQQIAKSRELEIDIITIQDMPASYCDESLFKLMSTAISLLGEPPLAMTSGAGHDAMVMAELCPTAMLFIRCKDGVSHHPLEDVLAKDVDTALLTMLEFIYLLAEKFKAERSRNDN